MLQLKQFWNYICVRMWNWIKNAWAWQKVRSRLLTLPLPFETNYLFWELLHFSNAPLINCIASYLWFEWSEQFYCKWWLVSQVLVHWVWFCVHTGNHHHPQWLACTHSLQYNAIYYNTIQCNAMQCNAMQCYAMQYNAIQCMQYNT